MRKNALSICCFTCAAGAIGAFCRWLQNQLAFDETGLSAASAWNYIVPLVLIAAAVCFYCIVARYKRSGLEMTTDFYGTFDGSTRLFVPLAWVIGAAMVFGALILIATGAADANAVLYRVLAALGVISGLAFGATAMAARRRYQPGLVCALATAPVLQFCLWLITSYKVNSTNPTVWVYAVEILAIAAALLAFYYFAGYPYGRCKPYSSLYFSMLGAFLCIVALADDRNSGLQLMLVSAVCMQLFWAWMITAHRHAPLPSAGETAPAEETAPAGEEKLADVSVNSILDEFHDGQDQ